MSLEAKLLLQEFRMLVAEFGDKLPMTERYRESLLNRLHAELKSLRPEEAAYRRVPAVPSLDLLEQMVEVYTGYLSPMDKGLAQHMEGMRLALEAAAASCLPQPHSTSEKT